MTSLILLGRCKNKISASTLTYASKSGLVGDSAQRNKGGAARAAGDIRGAESHANSIPALTPMRNVELCELIRYPAAR